MKKNKSIERYLQTPWRQILGFLIVILSGLFYCYFIDHPIMWIWKILVTAMVCLGFTTGNKYFLFTDEKEKKYRQAVKSLKNAACRDWPVVLEYLKLVDELNRVVDKKILRAAVTRGDLETLIKISDDGKKITWNPKVVQRVAIQIDNTIEDGLTPAETAAITDEFRTFAEKFNKHGGYAPLMKILKEYPRTRELLNN